MRTVPEITELNLPHERGYLTIEDDGDTIKAIIRPDLAGAVATDRLRWLRASVVAAGEYLGKLCDKGQPGAHIADAALHPNGACTCAGDGSCAWCKRSECMDCGAGPGSSACQMNCYKPAKAIDAAGAAVLARE